MRTAIALALLLASCAAVPYQPGGPGYIAPDKRMTEENIGREFARQGIIKP